jgi:enoyl-CoA hydratase/carnithine racemase
MSSASSGGPPLLSYPAPHVAEIRLDRPAQANRLDWGDLAMLSRHFAIVADDPAIHVILLSARGATFCAGFDLDSLLGVDPARPAPAVDGQSAFERVVNEFAALDRITIGLFNGPVVGGATDLALACDLRLAVPSAHFQMPAGRIGIPLYASALARYAAHLGPDLARQMILLGRRVAVDELAARHVLTEIVTDDTLEARGLALAREIAGLPTAPLAAMKRALNGLSVHSATEAQRVDLSAAFDRDTVAHRVAAQKAARKRP